MASCVGISVSLSVIILSYLSKLCAVAAKCIQLLNIFMNICKKPYCNKLARTGKNYCCSTHARQHAGSLGGKSSGLNSSLLPKRGVARNPDLLSRKEFIASFVGPLKVKRKRDSLHPTDARRICDRNAILNLATPVWANRDIINELYKTAQKLTTETGIPHAVDHIIPLKHPLVCGLHNEANLQILTKEENSKKNNKFTLE